MKARTHLEQNFEIREGRIFVGGVELPVRRGITPAYLSEVRSNPMTGKPRWYRASLLDVGQALDELFQKRNRIA